MHLVDDEPCSGCPNCSDDMAMLMRAENRGDFKAAVGRGERLLQKIFPRWMGGGKMATGTCFFPAGNKEPPKEKQTTNIPSPPTKEKQMRQTTTNIPSPPLSNTNDALSDPVGQAKRVIQSEIEVQNKRRQPQGGPLLSLPSTAVDPLTEMIRKQRSK